jgi:predicted Zn-dependent protease
MIGSGSVGSVLAQLGIGFAANSVLLKYSRDAERQADLLGAQILYDAGYNPNEMVEFFETLQAESKGRAVEFFSSHPNPDNRISKVKGEIENLGGAGGGRSDTVQFRQVRSMMTSAAVPSANRALPADSRTNRPEQPSRRSLRYNGRDIAFEYPENWRAHGQSNALTVAPDRGIVDGNLTWGMLISSFEPVSSNGDVTLQEATNQLLDELLRSNPQMRSMRRRERITVDGQRGLSIQMTNESPIGGREIDWLVTVLQPDGLLYYFVGVAPQGEFATYSRAFEDIFDSIRFSR